MPRAFPLVCLICCCAGLATAEPPERFAARMQGNSAIALSWEAVAGADALVVQRSATGGGWQDVATLPGSATAYTDNGLPSASLRLYRLALQVGGAVVGHSPLAWASSGEPVTSASTTQRTYALRLPEGGVRLYWEHRFGDVLRFRVESQLGSGAWTFRADASADTGSLVLPDPERSQTLKLRIRPESATATGAWTDAYAMVQAPYRVREVSPFPFAVDGATVAPANLTVQRQGPSTFLLNWTGSASDILRATDAATWHGLGVGNGLSTATVSTASHGLAQRFAVYNAGGWSNVVSIPALARDPSLPPASNVSSTLSGTTATITWDWSGSGATGFCVERWDHALLTDTWTTVAEVGAAQRSVVDPNSTSWVTYRVWVRSAIGWGPVAEMPLRDYPTAAPSGLVATAVSATQVSLSWTGTHYRHCLQRAEGAGPWRDLGPVGTTTFIDRGVVPGTTYRYRVSAVTRGTYANEITSRSPRRPPRLLPSPDCQ
jgi:hypothetical protein